MDLTWELMKELKRNKIIWFLLLLTFANKQYLNSQNNKEFGVMFYNVENLFDINNDSLKLDDEFTPEGEKHWTYRKYWQKLKNISRVIYESGGWNPPAIIGLCEIENKHVLDDLIWETGLNNLHYHIIHHESPDSRGIDVAMLYRNDLFTPLESIPITVDFGEGSRPTRDILYSFGYLKDTIPLHVFIAHFPSRYGGLQETKSLRYKAAQILNDTINHIKLNDPNANIIAMGDFNDNPGDRSMQLLLEDDHLKNISINPSGFNKVQGTLKHQFEWSIFDQFLVSDNLLSEVNYINCSQNMKILDFPFLLEEDKTNTGLKPFRTYIGYNYNNGFSDHLPIWLTIKLN